MGEEETSVREIPLSDTLVRQMYALACTPFERRAFQQKWREFGWAYTPAPGDDFGFPVRVAAELALTVAPVGDKIGCAILPFCYWEEYEPEWHDAVETHRAEERAYHAAYDRAFRLVEQTLGAPQRVGEDPPLGAEVARYRYAVWHGETSLFILQQCAHDIQFGLEINLWLEPCPPAEFHPEPYLIDWLGRRHVPPETEAAPRETP